MHVIHRLFVVWQLCRVYCLWWISNGTTFTSITFIDRVISTLCVQCSLAVQASFILHCGLVWSRSKLLTNRIIWVLNHDSQLWCEHPLWNWFEMKLFALGFLLFYFLAHSRSFQLYNWMFGHKTSLNFMSVSGKTNETIAHGTLKFWTSKIRCILTAQLFRKHFVFRESKTSYQ